MEQTLSFLYTVFVYFNGTCVKITDWMRNGNKSILCKIDTVTERNFGKTYFASFFIVFMFFIENVTIRPVKARFAQGLDSLVFRGCINPWIKKAFQVRKLWYTLHFFCITSVWKVNLFFEDCAVSIFGDYNVSQQIFSFFSRFHNGCVFVCFWL